MSQLRNSFIGFAGCFIKLPPNDIFSQMANAPKIMTSNIKFSAQQTRSTTILCVRKGSEVCMAGDGMVSQGQLVIKPNALKVRKLANGIIFGFAGTTADCFALREKLEIKLEEYPGQLTRSCVELAKQWRTDRYLRHLEAVLIVADDKVSLQVSGVGDVLESHDEILAIGSGGPYARAAARALYDLENIGAREICERSMKIAAEMCCHTNSYITYEVVTSSHPAHDSHSTDANILNERIK